MIITLRILLGMFQDWKPEKLWPSGVRPCRQKFLPLLDHRNFWTFRIFSKFFSKKSIFWDFDGRYFWGRGSATSKIFFWADPYRLGVKPGGRPKSRTGPPRGVANIFWLVISYKFRLRFHIVRSKTPFMSQYLAKFVNKNHKLNTKKIQKRTKRTQKT